MCPSTAAMARQSKKHKTKTIIIGGRDGDINTKMAALHGAARALLRNGALRKVSVNS